MVTTDPDTTPDPREPAPDPTSGSLAAPGPGRDAPLAPTRGPVRSGATRSLKAEALLGSAPDEQIAAAVASERWARAADLLALHGERILLDGGVRELAAWLMALPEEHRQKSAKLSALCAWVRIYDQHYQEALRYLSQAERALQQMKLAEVVRDSEEVELRPFAELEQSLSAIRLHLRAVSDAGGELPSQVEDIMIPASADHPLWRAGALVILGRCRYLAGDLGGASADLETAHVLSRETRGIRAARVAADAAVLLGRVAEARGALGAATTAYQNVLIDLRDGLEVQRLAAEVGLARVALARLDLDAAAKHLAAVRAAEATVSADPIRVVLEGELARSALAAMRGDYDDARLILDQLERALGGHQLRWPLELLAAQRARTALLRKDESHAKRWLQQQGMREANRPRRAKPSDTKLALSSPIDAKLKVTEAMARASLHEPEAAVVAANQALAFAEAIGHRALALDSLVALTLGHYGANQREGARAALLAALELAQATGYRSALLCRGLDVIAAELGVDSGLLAEVQAQVPALTGTPRDRGERGAPRVASTTNLIQTSQVVADARAEASAEASAEGGDEASAEASAEGDDEASAGSAEPAPSDA